jgi:hypothetical protein
MTVFRLLPLLAVLAVLVPVAPAVASTKQVMTFEAPRELLDDGARERTLDEIRAFGVRRVRVLMAWSSVAPAQNSRGRPADFDPADPADYPQENWARYDRLLEAAEARGIEVHVTLTGPIPRWATRARRANDNLTDPDPRAFGAFATAAGRRYGDRVRIWSIWNEPNQPQFLRPQFRNGKAASPGIYRRLFTQARKGLEASGNADDEILLGETSPRGNSRIVAPLAFLRGTLCLSSSYRKRRSCGRLDADGYAHHPYSRSSGPLFREPGRDNVTLSSVGRLVAALDRAGKAGAVPRGLGVYLTEFGTQSLPDREAGVSLTRQAEYNAISERLAYLNPRVKSFSQYLMTDDDPKTGDDRYSGFESGLRFFDGERKPAYDAFRTPLAVQDYGRSDVVWGLIRPAGGVTTAVVEYRNRGQKGFRRLRSVTTNAGGVFGFRTRSPAGRRYRVVWTAPDGTVHTGPGVRSYG